LGGARNEFWWNRLAQAEFGLGQLGAALDAINSAQAAVRDAKYRPAFWVRRFEIRKHMGDPSAVEDLRQAIGACEEPKYRALLEARLASELESAAATPQGQTPTI